MFHIHIAQLAMFLDDGYGNNYISLGKVSSRDGRGRDFEENERIDIRALLTHIATRTNRLRNRSNMRSFDGIHVILTTFFQDYT
jgi:hypothetical protein